MNQGNILFLMSSDICVIKEAVGLLLFFHVCSTLTTNNCAGEVHASGPGGEVGELSMQLSQAWEEDKRLRMQTCQTFQHHIVINNQAEGSPTPCRCLARFSSIYQGNLWGPPC